MHEFFVTFGQKYRSQAHPLQSYPHPDGWLSVQASDINEARAKTFQELGQFWSMIYTKEEFKENKHYYPKGELHRI
jgi:hypothetical protein